MQIEQRFLTVNPFSRPGDKQKDVRVVVLHWVENKLQSADGVWRYFEDRKHGKTKYGSTHYVIGLDGEIIQMVPEDEVAYSIGNGQYFSPFTGGHYTGYAIKKFGKEILTKTAIPNYHQVSIELCHTDWNGTIAETTLSSAVNLVTRILERHGLSPLDITTHHNIVGYKDCPKLWVEHPELFQEFVEQVREVVDART